MTPAQVATMRQAAADLLTLPVGTSDRLSGDWARWVVDTGPDGQYRVHPSALSMRGQQYVDGGVDLAAPGTEKTVEWVVGQTP